MKTDVLALPTEDSGCVNTHVSTLSYILSLSQSIQLKAHSSSLQ